MSFYAARKQVANRGIPPVRFLNELVAWGKVAPDDIFIPSVNHRDDVYSAVAGVLTGIEAGDSNRDQPLISTAWLTGAQATFAVVGVLAAAALGWGLWDSRNLPFVAALDG